MCNQTEPKTIIKGVCSFLDYTLFVKYCWNYEFDSMFCCTCTMWLIVIMTLQYNDYRSIITQLTIV